jgi:hypothetical protein
MSATTDQSCAFTAPHDAGRRDTRLKPSVLILCYDFPPENNVGALRPYRFAKFLPEHGFQVFVLTASTGASDSSLPFVTTVADPLTNKPRKMAAIIRRLAAIPLEIAALGSGNLSLYWSRRLIEKAQSVVAGSQIGYVISTFPPLATHYAAYQLKRRNPHLRWIADFRDPFAANPILSRRQALWHRRIEQRIFRGADALIANTDTVAERWQQTYPQWKSKVICIWNGFDPDEDVRALPIPDRPYRLMSHAGEIYAGRHPNLLLDALVRLIQSGKLDPAALHVHLVGEIDPESLPSRDSLDRLQASGCLILTPIKIPAIEAAKMSAESDFLLLLDWTGSQGGFQVPYKLYSYIRIGRPILAITNKQSPVDRILQQSGISYCCLYPDETSDQHDAKLLGFLKQNSIPQRPSGWFFENFDGQKQVSQLARLLDRT